MKIEYLLLLVICATGPFILSFSKKLVFYKNPRRLVVSILIPFILFVIWDIWAASRGHWGFNEKYVTGFRLFNLPIEEILFFIVIPFCGIFTWECVKYFGGRKKGELNRDKQ